MTSVEECAPLSRADVWMLIAFLVALVVGGVGWLLLPWWGAWLLIFGLAGVLHYADGDKPE